MVNKIRISVVVQGTDASDLVLTPLIFKLEDVERARKLGVCGILAGTLPTAAQQNMFLSVPLKLMAEEAIWLFLSGHAEVVHLRSPTSSLIGNLIKENLESLQAANESKLQESFRLQRQFKVEQHRLKLESLGRLPPGGELPHDPQIDSLIDSSLFVETANSSSILSKLSSKQQQDGCIDAQIINCMIANYSNWDNYLLYQSLRENGYVLSPGARFGGLYIAYPGDPLRYHSHITVQPAIDYYKEGIDLTLLTSGARLGTSVKKMWVIGGVKNYGTKQEELRKPKAPADVSFFSIEWAGFG
ncbi:tRNA splicing endonuclease subunit SEN34 KNAG_0B05570 [Huiozyma naganishii CBS 8797]|uniref:tRNA-splicing endonuclease subunit Sen34 n=1 Tax=Huiozyma naganishii (strain ATCC MYA-139 / BCRC 22969 / CBS 8797 / KCTC 17520 / NBRC 10181 / NCYC 3082 / Yp74L-3) TaxID=1071383 RepID=J7R2G2_HUIN7|nr:hypothetical protein KNAG_0B05570 [Kazachstania naganishii CBS 8797]CCK68990.1 hypothetical protein KNAG_0B05570 [Kazachstania naganishii CBS 8797]